MGISRAIGGVLLISLMPVAVSAQTQAPIGDARDSYLLLGTEEPDAASGDDLFTEISRDKRLRKRGDNAVALDATDGGSQASGQTDEVLKDLLMLHAPGGSTGTFDF